MQSIKTARICLDINVFYADLKGRSLRVFPSSCAELVEAVSEGTCPAGGIQLIISIPMLEQWQNVLVRHFNYSQENAEEAAFILYSYATEGPLQMNPLMVVGSDFYPFASETDIIREAQKHVHETHKLFNEIQDDKYVLLTAIAGKADILATANIKDFIIRDAIQFERDDVIVIPNIIHNLVIAKPSFITFWLRQGKFPNWQFILDYLDDFVAIADSREQFERAKNLK
jgi:hypothetical protein